MEKKQAVLSSLCNFSPLQVSDPSTKTWYVSIWRTVTNYVFLGFFFYSLWEIKSGWDSRGFRTHRCGSHLPNNEWEIEQSQPVLMPTASKSDVLSEPFCGTCTCRRYLLVLRIVAQGLNVSATWRWTESMGASRGAGLTPVPRPRLSLISHFLNLAK